MSAIDFLRSLYAVSGSALVLAYVPQVVSVWRCRQGATSVSLITWTAWSVAATVSLLYASCVLQDRSFGLVALGSALGCYAVTGVAALKRVRYLRARRAAGAP